MKFRWTPECQQAFDLLKQELITAPVLVLPDFSKPFVLTTDASTSGIAYILSQRDEAGREREWLIMEDEPYTPMKQNGG